MVTTKQKPAAETQKIKSIQEYHRGKSSVTKEDSMRGRKEKRMYEISRKQGKQRH